MRSDDSLNEETLDEIFRESDLENYKRPRKIYFVDEIPRNPSGKIVRARVLNELGPTKIEETASVVN